MVDGRIIMQDRRILSCDIEEIMTRIAELSGQVRQVTDHGHAASFIQGQGPAFIAGEKDGQAVSFSGLWPSPWSPPSCCASSRRRSRLSW